MRSWWRQPLVVELAVLGAVAFPTTMDASWNVPGTRQADWWTYFLVVGSLGALVVRHRWPIAVAVVSGGALTSLYALGHEGELLNLPTMVALYAVAVNGDRRRTIGVGVVAAFWSVGISEFLDEPVVGTPMFEILWPLVPLLFGEVVRGRRELLVSVAERATRAEADRERDALHRIEAERLRIAREFHDVVAHTMAAVNIQMGVAVAAFDTHPGAARAALDQARSSSREAMQELRATIAVLRSPEDGQDPAPAPRLDQLVDLVRRTTTAGIAVTLDRDHAAAVPAVVELAAYRIVQEALTNTIRHAGATNASVRVTVDGHALTVVIDDDGTKQSTSTSGQSTSATGGFGLVGMAERAAALGGRVEHGPLTGGGFRVHATLPITNRVTELEHR